ncbi:hypothetical protein V1281_005191 [Nitrobacteraceae bacterium AZCC 2161]
MLAVDAAYLRLRETGQPGWGGERFAERRRGWINTISRLQRDPIIPEPPAHLLEIGLRQRHGRCAVC